MKRNYEDPVYKQWRIQIFKRDKFKCQMPGCNSSKNLQAHHIIKWSTASSLRYEINNGITLCRFHHNEVNKKEIYYQSIFMEIINKNV